MEYPSLQKLYTGFHIVTTIQIENDVNLDEYPRFIGSLLNNIGFLFFDRAIDQGMLDESDRERIKDNGFEILQNPTVYNGMCLMALLMDRFRDGVMPSSALLTNIKAWMENLAGASGKDIKDYNAYVDILQSFMNSNLTEVQLRFLGRVIESGRSDIKGLEEDILKEQQERAAKNLSPNVDKKTHAKAIVNAAAKRGPQAPIVVAAINLFKSVTQALGNILGLGKTR